MGKGYLEENNYKKSEQCYLYALDQDPKQPLALQGLIGLRNLIINFMLERNLISFFKLVCDISWDVEYSKSIEMSDPVSERIYEYIEKKENSQLLINEMKKEIIDFIIITTQTYIFLMNLQLNTPQILKFLSEYGDFLNKSHQFYFILFFFFFCVLFYFLY
jgi:hypothetical protein